VTPVPARHDGKDLTFVTGMTEDTSPKSLSYWDIFPVIAGFCSVLSGIDTPCPLLF
jgi:hypothetical protein